MRVRFRKNKPNEEQVNLESPSNLPSVSFHIIQYDELRFTEEKLTSLAAFRTFLKGKSYSSTELCTWINIEGIARNDILDEISDEFKLHQLIKEDITTANERMKLDLLDNSSAIYLLMKMIYIHPDLDYIPFEQISFILKENNLLLTFQEEKKDCRPYDIFQVVKHRLKNNRGRIRSLKIDYLFYCLLDVVIENYMVVLDRMSLTIDRIDKLLITRMKQNQHLRLSSNRFNLGTLRLVFHLKHEMLRFKILCQPLREIIIKLQKAQDRISMGNRAVHSRRQYRRKKRPKHITLSGNYFFNPNNLDSTECDWFMRTDEGQAPLFNEYIFLYFKDLNGHILQLQDRIDTYCDVLSSLIAFYMILNDGEMNRLMTFLTLVTAIFIPMTLIIGLFSMNFQNMPPLLWKPGYFVTLGVVGLSAIVMFTLFKLKRWL